VDGHPGYGTEPVPVSCSPGGRGGSVGVTASEGGGAAGGVVPGVVPLLVEVAVTVAAPLVAPTAGRRGPVVDGAAVAGAGRAASPALDGVPVVVAVTTSATVGAGGWTWRALAPVGTMPSAGSSPTIAPASAAMESQAPHVPRAGPITRGADLECRGTPARTAGRS